MKILSLMIFTFSFLAQAELLPSGTVSAFDLTSCPTGWSTYDSAKQRTLLGSGTGNLDQLGGALSTRSYGQTGGFEHTTGVNGKAVAGSTHIPSTARFPASTSGPYNLYGPQVPDATETTIAGAKADSNMGPYYVIIYCRKD
ncbi:MAG: hypothetical protein KC493_03675 [Bacteriovoracaceae bacterium]|nr:hypothetical protein [Bacteriovoracaceae bacterium]